MSRIRTFIGVQIGEDIRRRAVALQQQLGRTGAGVKWVEPENLHITLLFLGEVDIRDILSVCKAVEQVAEGEPPISMHISGVGAFPTVRRPKVIWGGVSTGAEPLRRLYGLIEEQLLALKLYRREERGYTPHLTLGRTKSEKDGQEIAPELVKLMSWEGGQTTVNDVLVFSSEQRRDGPEYAVLARSSLGGS